MRWWGAVRHRDSGCGLARSCFTTWRRDACSLQWHFPTLFFVVTDLNRFSERFEMWNCALWIFQMMISLMRTFSYPNPKFTITKKSCKWSLFCLTGTFFFFSTCSGQYVKPRRDIHTGTTACSRSQAFCPSVTEKEAEVERGRGRETGAAIEKKIICAKLTKFSDNQSQVSPNACLWIQTWHLVKPRRSWICLSCISCSSLSITVPHQCFFF